jgi:hypothetical protein
VKINEGFQIETPNVFVPWGLHESDLRSLLNVFGLRSVTHGYYTLSCTSLGGLAHELGFHFYPRSGGILNELEFFRRSDEDQKASFEEFQKHFEAVFGKPTTGQSGLEGFPSYVWDLNGARILHYVFDRFGPEEHMRIQKA